MKYIIGNWKAYKTFSEAQDWMKSFISIIKKRADIQKGLEEKQICFIMCPPYHYLSFLSEQVKGMDQVFIGSQDVSVHDPGKYTGEMPAALMKDMISYAIIGHSERRSLRNETDEEIETKVSHTYAQGIEPIVCIRGADDPIPDEAGIVAYEPVEAIGTGSNMACRDVIDMKENLSLPPHMTFLYGGSVTRDNCEEYLSSPQIDGLLIGSASLDPEHFIDIAAYGITTT